MKSIYTFLIAIITSIIIGGVFFINNGLVGLYFPYVNKFLEVLEKYFESSFIYSYILFPILLILLGFLTSLLVALSIIFGLQIIKYLVYKTEINSKFIFIWAILNFLVNLISVIYGIYTMYNWEGTPRLFIGIAIWLGLCELTFSSIVVSLIDDKEPPIFLKNTNSLDYLK